MGILSVGVKGMDNKIHINAVFSCVTALNTTH